MSIHLDDPYLIWRVLSRPLPTICSCREIQFAYATMASNKTVRRKFRVPLKEGASLPCSQASSASGLAEVRQERGKESPQSWLSQLTATDEPLSSKHAKFSTDNAAKPITTPRQDLVPTREAVRPKGSIFSLDDSLCSISGVSGE